MKIPPYWIKEQRKGKNGMLWKLRGFSFRSIDEAASRLEKRFELLENFSTRSRVSAEEVEHLRAQLRTLDETHGSDYTVPLLEPIVEQIEPDNIITRNRYGVQVLNSTTLCFIDVDSFPLSLADRLRSFFGPKITPEEKLLRQVKDCCETDASLGARVYRTHNGWRIILTGDGIAPNSPRMHELFALFHADTLYESLCARQQCWRARLTPKPFRVGITRYPHSLHSEKAVTPETVEWLQRYEAACEGKAVCRLLEKFGRDIYSPLVERHDQQTAAGIPDRPLA